MSEYISKEDALKALCSLCGWDFFACDLCAEYCAIGEVTPADVKPIVRGEWINAGDFEQCSVCKGTHLKKVSTVYGDAILIKSDFCPKCGADMRERSEKE